MGRCGILDVGVSVAVCGAAPKTRRHFAGASRYDTVAPRCNESQEFRFFGELSFVTARFWKKFLIARSVCVGAGV